MNADSIRYEIRRKNTEGRTAMRSTDPNREKKIDKALSQRCTGIADGDTLNKGNRWRIMLNLSLYSNEGVLPVEDLFITLHNKEIECITDAAHDLKI